MPGGRGAKGGMESVHSFVTFSYGRLPFNTMTPKLVTSGQSFKASFRNDIPRVKIKFCCPEIWLFGNLPRLIWFTRPTLKVISEIRFYFWVRENTEMYYIIPPRPVLKLTNKYILLWPVKKRPWKVQEFQSPIIKLSPK